jgi:acyl carrier protein
MDALAHYRKSLGLPALSINWGAWEGDGMGKHVGGAKGRRTGITFMPPRLALEALDSAIFISSPQIAIGAFDWKSLKPMFEGSTKRPLLEHLSAEISGVGKPLASSEPVTAKRHPQEMRGASPEDREKNLVQYLITAVAPILAIDPAAIEPSRPLTDFGVDSLMALEFRNHLSSDLGVTIPTVRILEGITLQEVAAHIVKELPPATVPNSGPSDASLLSQSSASSAIVRLDEVLRVAPEKRQHWLENYLIPALAAILGVEPASVTSTRSISDYGLDSLMALELKNKIAVDLSVTVPTVRFLEGPSLREVAAQIASELPKALVRYAAPEVSEATIEYPLSFAQQQAYFGHKLMPDSAAFNVGFTAKASPHLDWPVFQMSVVKLLKRHPALRAVIVESDRGPVQRILPSDTPVASLIDASSMQESELKEQITRDFQKNFELDQPLFRVNVFRLANCDIMSFKVDHIIIDHWSVQLCVEDLKKIYSAELAGTEAVLPAVKGEYQDFVSWEAEMSQNADLWGYWKEKLGGVLPQLDIPSPRHRPAALLARGEAIPLLLPPELSAQIKKVARPLKATSYTFMLAAFQLLLHQFSQQNDIIVGTSVTGREDARWTNTIGFFVNVLPLRAKFTSQLTFADHLIRSRETVLGALQHQEFPFAAMITRLGLGRSLDRIPVFQAFFNFLTDHAGEFGRLFMGAEGDPVQFGGSQLFPWLTLPLQEGRVEVGVQLVEVQGHVDGYLNYNSDVMERATAEAMATAYGKILKAVVRDPNMPIENLAPGSEGLVTEREEFAL